MCVRISHWRRRSHSFRGARSWQRGCWKWRVGRKVPDRCAQSNRRFDSCRPFHARKGQSAM